MNKSRREADETMAELDEAKQESHMAQREGEIELEKARPDASRQITTKLSSPFSS